ncbi:hypothetical protein LINPERHAP1_LOCUS7380, partial [Linum perenne]
MTLFRNVEDDFCWVLCNIYGPVYNVDKIAFLQELRDVLGWWVFPFFLIGDFNMVRGSEEVSSGLRAQSEMDAFNNFIDDFGIMDLPLNGAAFTHSNMQANAVMSKIDRALVSPDWERRFSTCLLRVLVRTCSDHAPLVLDCGEERVIKRPWRFELMWFEFPHFRNVIKSLWEPLGSGSNGLFCLADKCKRVKQ